MSENLIKTGVIGHPISHSKSPLIHNYWIEMYQLEGQYHAIPIHPDKLKDGVQMLIDQGFAGFNVTVPHKQAIMEFCHDIDHEAKVVGAVNTVNIRNDLLYGTNTDVFGFTENLKMASRNFGFSWTPDLGTAVVLGAGGAARAIVYGLLKENVPEILIANRTKEKAQDLVSLDPSIIKAIDWEERSNVLSTANLLVNTTSLGMNDDGDLGINFENANEDILVHDIVYAPLYTGLLKDARAHDLRILTGIGMLLYQAQPAFEEWYDTIPEVTPALEEYITS